MNGNNQRVDDRDHGGFRRGEDTRYNTSNDDHGYQEGEDGPLKSNEEIPNGKTGSGSAIASLLTNQIAVTHQGKSGHHPRKVARQKKIK
jgi:hypothetical protein